MEEFCGKDKYFGPAFAARLLEDPQSNVNRFAEAFLHIARALDCDPLWLIHGVGQCDLSLASSGDEHVESAFRLSLDSAVRFSLRWRLAADQVQLLQRELYDVKREEVSFPHSAVAHADFPVTEEEMQAFWNSIPKRRR